MGAFCFFATLVAFVSVITFFIGVFMQLSEKYKKLGLQMILYSVIAFVIGFGTCFATLSIH